MAEIATDLKKMGDQIAELTLKDAKALSDYLKDEYGIEPAAGGAVAMIAPGAGAEEAAEPTAFDVVLESMGGQKIAVIKAVRAMTSQGLKEAKDMVEAAPKAVLENVDKAKADEAKAALEEAGAVVKITPK